MSEELITRTERVCDKYMKHTDRPSIVASAIVRQVIEPELIRAGTAKDDRIQELETALSLIIQVKSAYEKTAIAQQTLEKELAPDTERQTLDGIEYDVVWNCAPAPLWDFNGFIGKYDTGELRGYDRDGTICFIAKPVKRDE